MLRIDEDESSIQLTSREHSPTTANTGRLKGWSKFRQLIVFSLPFYGPIWSTQARLQKYYSCNQAADCSWRSEEQWCSEWWHKIKAVVWTNLKYLQAPSSKRDIELPQPFFWSYSFHMVDLLLISLTMLIFIVTYTVSKNGQ